MLMLFDAFIFVDDCSNGCLSVACPHHRVKEPWFRSPFACVLFYIIRVMQKQNKILIITKHFLLVIGNTYTLISSKWPLKWQRHFVGLALACYFLSYDFILGKFYSWLWQCGEQMFIFLDYGYPGLKRKQKEFRSVNTALYVESHCSTLDSATVQ